jgi:hypothetical protein
LPARGGIPATFSRVRPSLALKNQFRLQRRISSPYFAREGHLLA